MVDFPACHGSFSEGYLKTELVNLDLRLFDAKERVTQKSSPKWWLWMVMNPMVQSIKD